MVFFNHLNVRWLLIYTDEYISLLNWQSEKKMSLTDHVLKHAVFLMLTADFIKQLLYTFSEHLHILILFVIF